jgi:hypothetical protein
MAPDRYTELFFLDEATALAAGHRPCFECRRARFLAFREDWATGNYRAVPPETVKAEMIDDRLHSERVGSGRSKQTFTARIDELPDGVFVMSGGANGGAHLVLGDKLPAWSPGGYTGRRARLSGVDMPVLMPRSTMAAIRAGYKPEIHPSAFKA